MLAGPTPDSLAPVGVPVAHLGVPVAPSNTGLAFGGNVAVPGALPCQDAFVKMVAWDSLIWGDRLANVPQNQLGMTDIVKVSKLGGGPIPCELSAQPHFTQSAIVPVPEPAVVVFALVGGATLLLFGHGKRR